MNKLQFKGEWHELKGKLRQTFADLTDNDLDYAEGQEEELLGHLQKKLGYLFRGRDGSSRTPALLNP
jgi:uncharacterized protein YjbJ (UPF0337 family)